MKTGDTKAKTSQERQAAYRARIKDNPDLHEAHKKKERERWKRYKLSAKPKTDREQRHQRKKWRESKRQRKLKQKIQQTVQESVQETVSRAATEVDGAALSMAQTPVSECQPLAMNSNPSRQRQRGRSVVRRDRAAAYRTISHLRQQLVSARKSCERYRKQAERASNKLQEATYTDTPRSKTDRMIGGKLVDPGIRRTLLFHNVLCESIREKYCSSSSDKEKQLFSRLVASQLLKKYKLSKFCREQTGVSHKRLFTARAATSRFHYQRSTYSSVSSYHKDKVLEFLQRDDISRITTGKSDTITRCGKKMQRRLLTDTLYNLYQKYKQENGNSEVKLSYSTFCMIKPFWIMHPTLRDRQTCLCKLHENGRLLITKLRDLKIFPNVWRNIEASVDAAVCPEPQRACYTRQCELCRHKPNFDAICMDEAATVSWEQWDIVRETRTINGVPTQVKRTAKVVHSGSTRDVIKCFFEQLSKFCWHVMVLRHQFREYRTIKEKCSEQSCVVVVDFSENYTCQQQRAIQSAHFGASNNQVSLHTGVAYFKNQSMSFCSLSDCTRHDPSAIWAMMRPVLRTIRAEHPDVADINIWSDGPTTQYRNRNNFFLFSHQLYQEGFKTATWNYFEAGHGKSAADGVGGHLKRTADLAINHGSCITDAASLLGVLQERSSVKLFLVTEENVLDVDRLIQKDVLAIRGTMKLHQLRILRPGRISVRDLSCFCRSPMVCECHNSRLIIFPVGIVEQQQLNISSVSRLSKQTCIEELTADRGEQEVSASRKKRTPKNPAIQELTADQSGQKVDSKKRQRRIPQRYKDFDNQ